MATTFYAHCFSITSYASPAPRARCKGRAQQRGEATRGCCCISPFPVLFCSCMSSLWVHILLQLLPLLFPVDGERWKGRAGCGAGSSDCIVHISPEICSFLHLPADRHSHILHSSITSISSLSSPTITHHQNIYNSSLVSRNYPSRDSLVPIPSSPTSFLCKTRDPG